MSRYGPQRIRGGVVTQAGLDIRKKGQRRSLREPALGLYRAVVVNTYPPDHDENRSKTAVECDVILLRNSAPIPRVPVSQQNHGVGNASGLWIPRASKFSLASGIPINLVGRSRRGTFVGPVTSPADMDGDHVVVQFIEGRLAMPLITMALTHTGTRRKLSSGAGWAEENPIAAALARGKPKDGELYFHHQGTEVRVNQTGDVLVDTVGAHNDQVAELPASGAGQVRIRLKDLQKFTIECNGTDVLEVYRDALGAVHVDLGEGATEHIVLGDAFLTLFNAHPHPTAFGPTGVTTTPMVAGTHTSPTHRVK